MKKLLVAALVLSAVSVHADPTRSIYDLMYLPKAGTIYGFSQVDYIDARIMDSETKIDGEFFLGTQTLGYAPIDALSVQVSMNYVRANFDQGTDDFSGISDPTIAARFRLLDSDFRLDVLAESLVSLGDSETESDGDGDNLNGGHAVAAGAQFGMKDAGYQWSVKGLVRYFLEATTDNKETNVESEDDAHFALDLGADVLAKLSQESLVRAFTTVVITQEYEDDQNDATAANNFYTWGFEYQYLVSADLLAKAGISYSLTTGGDLDQADRFNFTVGANYQF